MKTRTIGLTSGCFDLLHRYHLEYLEKCCRYCDQLIVLVDSDSLIKINKNKDTIIKQEDRIFMLNHLECVEKAILINSIADYKAWAENPIIDVLFKNSTEIYGTGLICPEKTVIIPDVPGYSTTQIIESIREYKSL